MAVVARGTWAFVLVDISAHVYCHDDRDNIFRTEKRMYGLHVA